MRSTVHGFYTSKLWVETEKAYKQYVGGLCEECLAKGIYTPGVIVHHKKHLTNGNMGDPSIAYSFGNLELVCIECHNRIHGKAPKNNRFEILSDGTVVAVDSPLTR